MSAPVEDLIMVSIRCPTECSEAVHAALHDMGITGTVEEVLGEAAVVTAYLPASEPWAAMVSMISDRLSAVREAFNAEIQGPAVSFLAGQDWTEAWKQNYQPLKIGRVLIKPSWISVGELEPGLVVVELDPQMAFGTGTHASTQLALLALQEMSLGGAVIADVGTGTGILAIAAAQMGAAKVYATDNDPLAIAAACHNAHRNGVSAVVEVLHGDFVNGVPRGLDGIVANISPAADAELARLAPAYLKPGAWIILSGFTAASEEQVHQALDTAGFAIANRSVDGEWICLTGRLQKAERTASP
ncbi:MAG: 50S ribosomal protein L11 methyltransferase [Armatimonadetes bacterium]|nr:50S ribosomal protein L11 methyltransferase [Armatimonadota bacterium]